MINEVDMSKINQSSSGVVENRSEKLTSLFIDNFKQTIVSCINYKFPLLNFKTAQYGSSESKELLNSLELLLDRLNSGKVTFCK